MVKKISALLLALVLCLSVVVVPASAGVELGDAQFAISFEWDKSSYQAGDTAVLSLYADGADDLSFYTGAITFGLSSEVFDPAVHTKEVLREGSTTAEWFEAYYQPGTNVIAPLASSVQTKVEAANTAEENELYDWYVKVGFAKNGSGTHENTSTTKNGFYGTDFNPDEPFMTISFTVREDVADGTAVRAAVTTGTLTKPSATAPSTYIKYYKDPGNATTSANVPTSSTSISYADTNATNGEVLIGAAEAPSIVSACKDQIRFQKNADGTYANKFDVRALAKFPVADFEELAGKTPEEAITAVGFIFAHGASVGTADMDAIKAYFADGTALPSGYTDKEVTYITTKASLVGEGNYGFSCIVTDMADPANVNDTLIAVGYIAYTDAEGNTVYNFYEAGHTTSFNSLHTTYYPQAAAKYGW